MNIELIADITMINNRIYGAKFMNILIVDRDDITAQLIKARLEPLGHTIVHEHVKENAVDLAKSKSFDIVFIDPSPLKSAQNLIIEFRRYGLQYSYIVVLSESISPDEAIKSGSNAFLTKPVANDYLDKTVTDSKYLLSLIERIGDSSEDFPSAGGVIAKSAYNQLFLSALERADRYGERTFNLFISISNYKEILELDGTYAADYASATLSKTLSHLRRQSDIIAQTAKYEFALLLQRPIYETEPVEAANRFAESLSKGNSELSSAPCPIEIKITLAELPSGNRPIEHVLKISKTES